MRITNAMTIGKMLININRNATLIDKMWTQQATGKKISMPSDDPIIASRALKFRTNVTQTEQYIRNTQQGISWMSITEEGFINGLEAIHQIGYLCNQGANSTLEYADRQKIVESIKAYAAQIGSEMNIQYAGRYVFSGFRTDEPPIVENNDPKAVYDIKQQFTFNDVETIKTWYVPEDGAAPEVYQVYRIKLPYVGTASTIDDPTVSGCNPLLFTDLNWTVPGNPPTTNATTGETHYKTIGADPGNEDIVYRPKDNSMDWHFIPETGEIILSEDMVEAMRTNSCMSIDVSYTKVGLSKGDLNPRVYFECIDKSLDPKGTQTPEKWFEYNMRNEELTFEFGPNTRIGINSLARDVYTPQLYADLMRLVQDISGIELSTDTALKSYYDNHPVYGTYSEEEKAKLIEEQKSEEVKKYNGVMQDMFNSMLGLTEVHMANMSKQDTALGSKMTRLNLIQERLETDRLSYTGLMSENEDVDYLEVMMRLSAAQNVYQASLKTGASIAQMSLADYI